MGTIGNTLGIVGRGRAVDNLFRAIADGAIPLEGIDRIVFYNHTEGEAKEKEDEFKGKILGKTPLPNDKTTAKDILNAKGISVEVYNIFTPFYKDSSVVLFTSGKEVYSSEFKDIFDAIVDDFAAVDKNCKFIRQTSKPFYEVIGRLLKENIPQNEFFKGAYEKGNFQRVLESIRSGKTSKTNGNNGHNAINKGTNEEQELEVRITAETINTIFQMKIEGMLPYGHRIFECFAPSLFLLAKYGKLFRESLIRPEKPVLVLTNEPSMACNILALFNPDLTPFLIGLNDYDTDRFREKFAEKFGLNKDELEFGIVGDHESYTIPVFKKEFFERHPNIKYEDAHEFFREVVYTYVLNERNKGNDTNVGVRTSLVKTINAAIRSLGSSLSFEGDFYNGVFVPLNRTLNTQGYSYSREIEESVRQGKLKLEENNGIFATSHHSFCNGRAVPLDYEVSEYAKHQFLNCLGDYTTLLYRLMTNDVIGEQFVDSITKDKICCFPYVKKGEQEDKVRKYRKQE